MPSLINDLREAREKLTARAKILTFDIETQRAIVEVFSLFGQDYIHMDRVKVPARMLCFSARWLGEDEPIFEAAWEDSDTAAYAFMVDKAWSLLDSADIVVTWNGDRFDRQWVEAEGVRLGLGRPMPYKSVDLMKLQKAHFKAGIMSQKLQWSARHWLRDSKVAHGGRDLWDDIRYGTLSQKAEAQLTMQEYCEHDTKLTEDMLWYYLPYLKINMALYCDNEDGELRCTSCGKTGEIVPAGKDFVTGASTFMLFRCLHCGSPSRGRSSTSTTELRPV